MRVIIPDSYPVAIYLFSWNPVRLNLTPNLLWTLYVLNLFAAFAYTFCQGDPILFCLEFLHSRTPGVKPLAETSVTCLCTDPPPPLPTLLLTGGGGGGSVHMPSVTCCNLTYLPNNGMCILPMFLRTFLIISVILDQDPYVWFRRETERRSQMFKELEKLLKELQNPEASLDLILTEQLQTKHVCWGHCLLYRPNS